MIVNPKIVTAPTQRVVSLARLKGFLRIDTTDDDNLLEVQLKAAEQRLEKLTGVKFVTQTWDLHYNGFAMKPSVDSWWDGTKQGAVSSLYDQSSGGLKIPFGPINSVTGVYTYDDADVEYTFAASNYNVDTVSNTPCIALKSGSVWPSTVLRTVNGVKVRAVFGFGVGIALDAAVDDASDCPEDIQEAVKQFAALLYEHRGDELPKIPPSVQMLLDPYRRVQV